MFEGFSPHTIDFMWNLRLNNQKPWFEAHKDEYLRNFLSPMKELGREVFERVTAACGNSDFIHKVSRIYKDARRQPEKQPSGTIRNPFRLFITSKTARSSFPRNWRTGLFPVMNF